MNAEGGQFLLVAASIDRQRLEEHQLVDGPLNGLRRGRFYESSAYFRSSPGILESFYA